MKRKSKKDYNVFVKLGVKASSIAEAESTIRVALARAMGNDFERFDILASRLDNLEED